MRPCSLWIRPQMLRRPIFAEVINLILKERWLRLLLNTRDCRWRHDILSGDFLLQTRRCVYTQSEYSTCYRHQSYLANFTSNSASNQSPYTFHTFHRVMALPRRCAFCGKSVRSMSARVPQPCASTMPASSHLRYVRIVLYWETRSPSASMGS